MRSRNEVGSRGFFFLLFLFSFFFFLYLKIVCNIYLYKRTLFGCEKNENKCKVKKDSF